MYKHELKCKRNSHFNQEIRYTFGFLIAVEKNATKGKIAYLENLWLKWNNIRLIF